MRKLKYILLLILSTSLFNSCVDDTTNYDLNSKGANLAGFELGTASAAAIADGNEYTFKMKVKIVGPTRMDLTSDITLTIGADAASTAIAGTHYRIDNPTVVLKASNNYLGFFEFKMLTAGIITPLAVAPKLVLAATAATGDASVKNNGKPITITMNYACFSNLAGNYDVHGVVTRSISGAVTTYNWNEDITETGIGEYRTGEVAYGGYWALNGSPGTAGFTFTDNCNVITVPEQTLFDYYSNLVYGTNLGSVDPITGVIHVEYTLEHTTSALGHRICVSDYTPVP